MKSGIWVFIALVLILSLIFYFNFFGTKDLVSKLDRAITGNQILEDNGLVKETQEFKAGASLGFFNNGGASLSPDSSSSSDSLDSSENSDLSDSESGSESNYDSSSGSECVIESVSWSDKIVEFGENVQIVVYGEGCDKQKFDVEIFEKDTFFRDKVTVLEDYFVNGRALIDWEINSDFNYLFDELFEGEELELYFEVNFNNSKLVSSLLTVSKEEEGVLLQSVDNPNNFVTITEKDGQSTTNYPIEMGRVFIQGEIPNYPQVLINGVPVTTQSDVKSRWADGSAKHAILSFYIPQLNSNQQVIATFQNQQTGNNQGFLTQSSMLGSQYNFDARISLTNGVTVSSSARNMLSNNTFEYWLQGSESTSIILADHSNLRKYDIGFDSYKSFRPIFLATFFPGANKVRVRYIGEVANSEALQDMQYDLSLTLGNSNPQTVYTKNNLYHYLATRWTKEFWIGGEPSSVDINHNLAYLKETGFISNYDTGIVIPPIILTNYYNSKWLNVAKDLYDPASYVLEMGTSGGRDELGPWPRWSVYWLFTGDSRFAKMNSGMADLAAAWPVHLREGSTGRFFDRSNTFNATGKILSTNARPTFRFLNADSSPDNVSIVGLWATNSWKPDCAHIPDPYSIQYALSGDYWYLEELWFWSSYGSLTNGYGNYGNSRGPTGREGDLNEGAVQVRGMARCLPIRARTAYISPDNSVEKSHFNLLTQEFIASKEGLFRITGTDYENNSMWLWGRDIIGRGAPLGHWMGGTTNPPVLHHMGRGLTGYYVNVSTTSADYAIDLTWQQAILVYALGHLEELGYATEPLKNYLGEYITGYLNNPEDTIKYLVSEYRTPIFNIPANSYYSTYESIRNQFLSSYLLTVRDNFLSHFGNPNHGYTIMVMGAVSHLTSVPSGEQAWNWIFGVASAEPSWSLKRQENPQWAFLPRFVGTGPILNSITPPTINVGATINLSFNGFNFDSNSIIQICNASLYCENRVSGYVSNNLLIWEDYFAESMGIQRFRIHNFDNQVSGIRSINVLPPAPAAPSGLQVSGLTYSQVNLTWTDVSNNEDGFYIERSLSPTSGFTQVGTNGANDNTFTDSTVSHSTTYYYRVRAFNSGGNSAYSNPLLTVNVPVAPSCSAQSGNICSAEYYCPGTSLVHSGSGICCSITCQQGDPTLAGHWKFDDTVSPTDNAIDSSIYGLHGTCTTGACPSYLAAGGQLNGAYDFDGINDEITVTDNNLLDLTTQGTIMAWVKKDSSKWHGIIAKGNIPIHAYEMELTPGSRFTCRVGGGNFATSTIVLADNNYYHVACSWNAGALTIYVNGVLEQTVTGIPNAPINNGNLHIGSWPPLSGTDWDWMNGSIDDVRIYNRALTLSEIQAVMGTSGGFDFGVSVNPAFGSVSPGNSVLSTVTATHVSGTFSAVSFSASNLPTGVTASFNPTSCTPVSGIPCTSTMTLMASSGAQIVTNRQTAITGTSGSIIRQIMYSLNVTANLIIPNAPLNLAAFALNSTSIRLNWIDNSTNENYFIVQRRTLPSGSFANVSAGSNLPANSVNFIDNGLTADTSYQYRVAAVNFTSGSSNWSNSATGTTNQTLPAPASGLTAFALNSTGIRINWTDNSNNENGFAIWRCVTLPTCTFSFLVNVLPNTINYTDNGLNSSTNYQYRVRSFNAAGGSGWSNSANATTLAWAVPNAPSNLVAVALSQTSIRLNWTDNSNNENNFIVQYKLNSTTSWNSISLAINSTNYNVTGLTSGTSYDFRVFANNSAGMSQSNTVSATTSFSSIVISSLNPNIVLNNVNRTVFMTGNSLGPHFGLVYRRVGSSTASPYCSYADSPNLKNCTWINNTLIRFDVLAGMPGASYEFQFIDGDTSQLSNFLPLTVNSPFNYILTLNYSNISVNPGTSIQTTIDIESSPFMAAEVVNLTVSSSPEIITTLFGSGNCVPNPSCQAVMSLNIGGISLGQEYYVRVTARSLTTFVQHQANLTIYQLPAVSNPGPGGGGSSGGGGGGGGIRISPAQCSDNLDNDGDRLVDFEEDLGCTTRNDNNELDVTPILTGGNYSLEEEQEGNEIENAVNDIQIRLVFWIILIVLLGGITFVGILVIRLLKRERRFKRLIERARNRELIYKTN